LSKLFKSGYEKKHKKVKDQYLKVTNQSIDLLSNMLNPDNDLLMLTKKHGDILKENLLLKKRIYELKHSNKQIKNNFKKLKMYFD
jgi:hypothetical protein